jgi:hypothetical protein
MGMVANFTPKHFGATSPASKRIRGKLGKFTKNSFGAARYERKLERVMGIEPTSPAWEASPAFCTTETTALGCMELNCRHSPATLTPHSGRLCRRIRRRGILDPNSHWE